MHTTTSLALTLAALATASPLRRDTGSFSLISIHSGDPSVHLRSITANGLEFWLGKPTSSYCSPTVGTACPSGNATILAGGDGSVSMSVEVPGGQQTYVDAKGNWLITQAHTVAPAGAIFGPFNYTAPASEGQVGELTGPAGFVACPAGNEGDFQIKVALEGVDTSGCTGIVAGAVPATGPGAWQYS